MRKECILIFRLPEEFRLMCYVVLLQDSPSLSLQLFNPLLLLLCSLQVPLLQQSASQTHIHYAKMVKYSSVIFKCNTYVLWFYIISVR